MNPQAVAVSIDGVLGTLSRVGNVLEAVLLVVAAALLIVSLVPSTVARRRLVLAVTVALLGAGALVLVWFHWRLYGLAVVVDPSTNRVTGHVAVPLWVESEKLYFWALIVAIMGLFARDKRKELLPGIGVATAVLILGAALWGRPFTSPLPSFLSQYAGYLQGMASGVGQTAQAAFEGMEASRQFYYNTWYMWVHPPLLFFSYGAFVVSFIATLLAIAKKHSSYEALAYRWARIGYFPLTAGMLLGFPWALIAWSGQAWWWSGKVNMSIMMWLLYTAYLHGRLYLRRRGMWRWVLALAVLAFAVLLLTYIASYVIPGAHSYV